MKKLITLFICVLIQVSFANSQYWKEIETIPSPFNSNYWLDVYFHPSNSNYGWVCGFNGMVIRTTDGGNTWAGAYVAGAYHLEHVHFPSLTTGYTSGPDGIFKSTNGGQTWAEVTPDIDWDYWGCYFVNDNVGLVVGGGCVGNQRFYKTTNGGTSWSDISAGLPDVPTESVVIDPQYPQNIYVGNDLGVYCSTNNGSNWYVYNLGMPPALIFDLTIVYPNRHIRATTHGNGVYERSLVPNPLVGVVKNTEVPQEFKLYQNYPNPFNPSSKIKYQLAKSEYVLISVYDITGKTVKTLVNEKQNAGTYEVKIDASGLSSGVYFYRLTAGSFTDVKKMMLVK